MKKHLLGADILLPKENFENWAVIACDQYTSEPNYWEETKKCAGDKPSALNIILKEYEIITPLRICHFFFFLLHESGHFKYKSENLNYSAKALRSVFGKYFKTDEIANEYARKPERIANVHKLQGNGTMQHYQCFKSSLQKSFRM